MESQVYAPTGDRTVRVKHQLEKARIYETTGTAVELQADLLEIGRLDQQHSSLASRYLVFSLFAFATLFCTFCAAILSVDQVIVSGPSPVLAVLFIAQIPLLIWLYRKYRWHRRLDGENRRFTVPAKLIRYLSTDMAPNTQMHLKIDFRHYGAGPFQKGVTIGGAWRRKSKSRYEVPWLSLKSRLLDGSRFQFEISQLVRKKVKRKKRTTCSEVLSDRYDLALIVKPGRYRNLARFPEIFPTVKPPEGLTISTVRVSDDRLEVQATSRNKYRSVSEHDRSDPFPQFSVDPALQMFLSTYQCLGKCKAQTQP